MAELTFPLLLVIHVLGATIWTGGHLILVLRFLPEALRQKDLDIVRQFEERFEPVGLAALGTQIVTGLWLAWLYLPDWSSWLDYHSPIARDILLKLGLLILTLILALDARLRLIPNQEPNKLTALAAHIVGVSILSVLFVVVGVGLRLGGI